MSKKKSPDSNLVKLYEDWSSEIKEDEMLFINDFIYTDNQIDEMRPSQAFAYCIGLELALDASLDTLPVKLLKNFNIKPELIRTRTKPFKFAQKKCDQCDFHSESKLVLDQHLTNPHHFTSINRCNFCSNFKTSSREEYRLHIFHEHGRNYVYEKPLPTCVCSLCDYECGSDHQRLQRHEERSCALRNRHDLIEKYLQAPASVDLLEHEFLFNVKQPESLEPPNPLNSQYEPWNNNNHHHNNNNGSNNIDSSHKQLKIKQIPPSPQNKTDIISCEASQSKLACHICPSVFQGLTKLSMLMKHYQTAHKVNEALQLNSILRRFVIPQITKTVEKPKIVVASPAPPVSLPPQPPKVQRIVIPDQVKPPIQTVNKTDYLTNKLTSSLTKMSSFEVEKKFMIESVKKNKHDIHGMENYTDDEFDKFFATSVLYDVKNLAGKCYFCNNVYMTNLLKHLSDTHSMDVEKMAGNSQCLCCGLKLHSRDKLIAHQMQTHKLLAFGSLNRLYAFSQQNLTPQVKPSQLPTVVNVPGVKQPPVKINKLIETIDAVNKKVNNDPEIICIDEDDEVKEVQKEEKAKEYSCFRCLKKFDNPKDYTKHVVNDHADLISNKKKRYKPKRPLFETVKKLLDEKSVEVKTNDEDDIGGGDNDDDELDLDLSDEKVDEKMVEKVDEKMVEKVDEKIEEKVDEKIEEKVDEKIEEKLDKKLDEKLEEKKKINNLSKKCFFCGKEFLRHLDYENHLKKEHMKRVSVCLKEIHKDSKDLLLMSNTLKQEEIKENHEASLNGNNSDLDPFGHDSLNNSLKKEIHNEIKNEYDNQTMQV